MGDLTEKPLLGERVSAQPRERIGRADPELGHHHAGRLMDLRPIAPRPVPGLLLAGIAAQPQEDQRCRIRSTERIPHLGRTQGTGAYRVDARCGGHRGVRRSAIAVPTGEFSARSGSSVRAR
jgi:hypothetical protein